MSLGSSLRRDASIFYEQAQSKNFTFRLGLLGVVWLRVFWKVRLGLCIPDISFNFLGFDEAQFWPQPSEGISTFVSFLYRGLF